METRIGISGWRYEPWRGVFYPPKLPHREELAYASRQVASIELNGSFYSLQNPERYRNWYAATPDNFKFSVKGPRYVTHIRRLKEVEAPLANFFGSGVFHLKEKLGPFLWQFPPNFLFREEVFEDFFSLLPKTFKEAVALSKRADRVDPDFPARGGSKMRLRHAIEVRHQSFLNPDFIALLRRHQVAFVFADTAGKWPYMEDLTSDFVYLRLHGEQEIYRSGYDSASLAWWAERIRLWRSGRQPKDALTMSFESPEMKPRDVFVYFDNDVKVHAPFDAAHLAARLNTFHAPKGKQNLTQKEAGYLQSSPS